MALTTGAELFDVLREGAFGAAQAPPSATPVPRPPPCPRHPASSRARACLPNTGMASS
jgi:hypothetical protein